jgi:hypothetical protein
LEVISFPSGNARSDQQWQPYCYYFCDSDDHPLFYLARNIRASSIHRQTKLCVPSLFIRCSPHLSLHRPPCAVLDCLPTSSWLPSCVPDRSASFSPSSQSSNEDSIRSVHTINHLCKKSCLFLHVIDFCDSDDQPFFCLPLLLCTWPLRTLVKPVPATALRSMPSSLSLSRFPCPFLLGCQSKPSGSLYQYTYQVPGTYTFKCTYSRTTQRRRRIFLEDRRIFFIKEQTNNHKHH